MKGERSEEKIVEGKRETAQKWNVEGKVKKERLGKKLSEIDETETKFNNGNERQERRIVGEKQKEIYGYIVRNWTEKVKENQ